MTALFILRKALLLPREPRWTLMALIFQMTLAKARQTSESLCPCRAVTEKRRPRLPPDGPGLKSPRIISTKQTGTAGCRLISNYIRNQASPPYSLHCRLTRRIHLRQAFISPMCAARTNWMLNLNRISIKRNQRQLMRETIQRSSK